MFEIKNESLFFNVTFFVFMVGSFFQTRVQLNILASSLTRGVCTSVFIFKGWLVVSECDSDKEFYRNSMGIDEPEGKRE